MPVVIYEYTDAVFVMDKKTTLCSPLNTVWKHLLVLTVTA